MSGRAGLNLMTQRSPILSWATSPPGKAQGKSRDSGQSFLFLSFLMFRLSPPSPTVHFGRRGKGKCICRALLDASLIFHEKHAQTESSILYRGGASSRHQRLPALLAAWG